MENNLQFVNSIDNRLKVLEGKKPIFDLVKGCKNVEYKFLESANGNSSTGTQYTIYANENQLLSDYLTEEIQFKATFTISNNDTNDLNPFASGGIAPRAFVLDSISQQNAITINGQTVSYNPQDSLNALVSFNNKEEYAGKDIQTSTLDYFADYAVDGGDVINPAQTVYSTTGSLKNPLLDITSSTYGVLPRFNDITIINIQNAQIDAGAQNESVVFEFKVRQPFMTGVTSLSYENASAFCGATIYQLKRNFVSNMPERLLSYLLPNDNLVLEGVSVEIVNARLYHTLYTPDDSQVLPRPSYYPVLDYGLKSEQQSNKTVQPKTAVSIASQTLSLSVVPKCIYVYVCVPNRSKTYSDADTFYKIESLTLSYAGQAGQFSGANEIQLYDDFMGSQGYKYAYTETGLINLLNNTSTGISEVGMYGSVLRIPATALGNIPWDRVSVGTQYASNLQVQVTARNLSANSNSPSLFIQIVNDNVLSIDSPSSATIYQGVLDQSQVAQVRKTAPTEALSRPMLAGGMLMRGNGFFSDMWSGIKKVGSWVKDHKDDILNTAKAAAPMLGLGRKRKSKKGSALRRSKSSRRRMLGGGIDESDYSESEDEMIGGAYLSKLSLQHKLK